MGSSLSNGLAAFAGAALGLHSRLCPECPRGGGTSRDTGGKPAGSVSSLEHQVFSDKLQEVGAAVQAVLVQGEPVAAEVGRTPD